MNPRSTSPPTGWTPRASHTRWRRSSARPRLGPAPTRLCRTAGVAQLVERSPCKRNVAGSTPVTGSMRPTPGPSRTSGWGYPHRDRRATVRAASQRVRAARCRLEPEISTFGMWQEATSHHPRASPFRKVPPCLTSFTESATSPAATRGASSPPGSSSPARSSCSTPHRAASTTRASIFPGSESQRAADAIEDRFPQETLYSSNVIFHSEERAHRPGHARPRSSRPSTELTEGEHVIAVSSPYDPRGPTVSEDGQTAFATVAFDIEKVGVEELDAAEKAVQDVRDAGIQVEYDGGLGYAEVPSRRQQRDDRHPPGDRHPRRRLRVPGRDEPPDRRRR